jgi:hypothetical protein
VNAPNSNSVPKPKETRRQNAVADRAELLAGVKLADLDGEEVQALTATWIAP